MVNRFLRRHYTRSLLENNIDYIRGAVLDLGCGRCKYKDLILAKAVKYTGADFYDYGQVDVVCEADKTPFEDNFFDTVICSQVLEHVLRPHKVIEEIARITKKGGHIILITPWLHPYHGEPKDYYRFSRDALVYLFESNNLKVVKTENTGGRWRVAETFARRWIKNIFIYGFFSKIFLLCDYFSSNKHNLDTPSNLIIGQK